MPPIDTGAVKALKKTISNQKQTIVTLQERISGLTDEVMLLQHDLKDFKKNVAADINELYDLSAAE